MSFHPALELDDASDRLVLIIDTCEGRGDLSHLHRVNDSCDLCGQLLHLETRGHAVGGAIRHKTLIVLGVFIIRDIRGTGLEGELVGKDVVTDRVKTLLSCVNLILRHFRSEQNVAHIDLITAFVDELNDMIAEFRLHDLRHLLRIGQVESHLSEGGIQHTTTHKAQLTALTG